VFAPFEQKPKSLTRAFQSGLIWVSNERKSKASKSRQKKRFKGRRLGNLAGKKRESSTAREPTYPKQLTARGGRGIRKNPAGRKCGSTNSWKGPANQQGM